MLRVIGALLALFFFAPLPAAASAGPVDGPDGVLRFPFGQRIPPMLRCKPLFVCDLVLEPGETIVNVAAGDSVRWLIAPASSGIGENATPHVLIKPTEAGLHTNLIITTNRRTYYLTLDSNDGFSTMRIGFLYPQDLQRDFGPAFVGHGVRPGTLLSKLAIDKLDFNYHSSGDRSLQPLRVFNDSMHTYLQMPPGMSEMPVLFSVGNDGGNTLVNYRFTGQYFVVDGVPPTIALISGGGKHQRRALITHGG